MELRHLRYFVALADELHFGRAAETAYVAQSTLSQQIQAFEEEMGVTFFERSPGGVELTEAGRTFRPYAERVLQEARRAESIARAARDGLAGLLSITYEATAMRSGLPPIIKAFREDRPHGELDLAEQTTREQVDALRAEEADAGFLFLPINERGLHVQPLFTAPMVVVLPTGHRLSDRDAIPLHELEGEPHVIWARGGAPRIHDAYVRACHDAGFTPRIIQDIERGESFLGLVEAGLGVSIAHASNLQIQRPGVRYAKIRGGTPRRPTAT
jgi:DNA-binding transcriptional LysR family regulator